MLSQPNHRFSPCLPQMPLNYKDAGVDLDRYDEAIGRLPRLMERTRRPGVLPLPGGFAGLFQLNSGDRTFRDPVLVSGADGVGTKLKIAQMTGRFTTIGIDLVAMCVNDCLCVGAEPLFFLDYLALGRDNPDLIADLVKGVSDGCVTAGAALLGGETAVMPDCYDPDDFDLAGFCVGVVERDRIIDGSEIQPGDVLLGAASDGLHSNGFSLVRKVVFDHAGLSPEHRIDKDWADANATVGELLLTPTRIYASAIKTLAEENLLPHVTGIAHITGGGIAGNVERLLPASCDAVIDTNSWNIPGVFGWLQELGDVADEEMYRVFNMGLGLVLCVRPDRADAVTGALRDADVSPTPVGRIVSGTGQASYS